jgi:hypothetical protein
VHVVTEWAQCFPNVSDDVLVLVMILQALEERLGIFRRCGASESNSGHVIVFASDEAFWRRPHKSGPTSPEEETVTAGVLSIEGAGDPADIDGLGQLKVDSPRCHDLRRVFERDALLRIADERHKVR